MGEVRRSYELSVSRTGETVTVDVSVSPVLDEHGAIEGFLAVQRNISERKRAETTILRQKAMLEGILASTTSAVFSVDHDYCYTSFNHVHADRMWRR